MVMVVFVISCNKNSHNNDDGHGNNKFEIF